MNDTIKHSIKSILPDLILANVVIGIICLVAHAGFFLSLFVFLLTTLRFLIRETSHFISSIEIDEFNQVIIITKWRFFLRKRISIDFSNLVLYHNPKTTGWFSIGSRLFFCDKRQRYARITTERGGWTEEELNAVIARLDLLPIAKPKNR